MKNHLLTRRSTLPILLSVLISTLGSIALLLGIGKGVSTRLSDEFYPSRAVDPSIVIAAIDNASLSEFGRWPWDRHIHTRLIQALSHAGAKGIVYDVNFPDPTVSSTDQELANAIHTAGNVILPVELSLNARSDGWTADPLLTVQPLDAITRAAYALGHSNTPLDTDNVVRRVPVSVQGPQAPIYSMAYAAALMTGWDPVKKGGIPTDAQGNVLVSFPAHPENAFPTLSVRDILNGSVDEKKLQGKMIFVGATAPDLHDERIVPTSRGLPLSGVALHAALYDTLIGRHWLRSVPIWLEIFFFFFLALLLGVLLPRIRPFAGFLVTFIVACGCLLISLTVIDAGYLFDPLRPALVTLAIFVALLAEHWFVTERKRRELRSMLGQYVTSSVVDAFTSQPEKLQLGGARRHMSVLFSDLRGFTTLSEGLSPERLVEVLNRYLNAMTEIVFEEQGVLDKYIGDAVMAFWNAPLDQTDHASRATRTALKMRKRLQEMNESGAFPEGIVLRVGVGVNTGDMVVGNIGGERRYDYTVIGDSVNLASRVEGLNKEYATEVIVTASTKQALGDGFVVRMLDRVAVKGKSEPVTIYEVIGFTEDVTNEQRICAKQYEAALEAYFHQQFDDAVTLCENLLKDFPNDGPTKTLLGRARAYQEHPPLTKWDGAWVMTKK